MTAIDVVDTNRIHCIQYFGDTCVLTATAAAAVVAAAAAAVGATVFHCLTKFGFVFSVTFG